MLFLGKMLYIFAYYVFLPYLCTRFREYGSEEYRGVEQW